MVRFVLLLWFSGFAFSQGNPSDQTCPLDGCTLPKLCHLIKDVAQLRNDVSYLTYNITELNKRGRKNSKDILQLKSSEVLVKTELINVKQENQNLKQRLNQLEQDNANNKLVVKNITRTVSALEMEVSSLKGKNSKLEGDIADIRNLIKVLNKTKMDVIPPRDCSGWKKKGYNKNGVYEIRPDNRGSFKVYCDMTTAGGGWTVIQRRADGSVDFYRTWNDYKVGFGSLDGEFWLGNDKIHRIVSVGRHTIRFDLQDWKGATRHAEYSTFSIGSEDIKYKLNVTGYSGTAGDSFGPHNTRYFSTKDRDNDVYSGNCAVSFKGGWWYEKCHWSNLNGLYLNGPHKSYADGIEWYAWHQYHNSLTRTEMKIRPFSY